MTPPNYPKPPQTVFEFVRRFPDEAACADYLFQLRYPNGYVCPKCGSTRAYKSKAVPGTVQCENKHKISVTAGTALHRTKQPLSMWFHAAWLVATMKPGISAVQFQRQLGLSRLETAWTMLHKLRAALYAPERQQLTTVCHEPGHGRHWIEVDETYVGGKEEGKERRGRGAESKALVAVAVEVHEWQDAKGVWHTKAGRCRMRVIPDATAATLADFVQENVEPGSLVSTDAHAGYNFLPRAGYGREITVAKRSDDPLPTMGRVTTNLKRWLIGTHKGAVQSQHLQAYLNEFVFRFNRRDIPWIAFNRALGLAALDRPAVEYEGLYKGTWAHKNPAPTSRRKAV